LTVIVWHLLSRFESIRKRKPRCNFQPGVRFWVRCYHPIALCTFVLSNCMVNIFAYAFHHSQYHELTIVRHTC
jgi:hypothetical protein